MTRFEYLSVLVSIVVALGLSDFMMSWVYVIRRREQIRFSWLHGFWSAFMLYLLIQMWWAFWNFRTVTDWTLLSLIFVVMESILLVVCALLIHPPRKFAGNVNLSEWYFDNARAFFAFGSVLLLQLCIADIFIMDLDASHPENVVRYFGALLAATLAIFQNRRLHHIFPVLALVLLVLFNLNALIV